ncbi:TIGR04222 domain-containing membrane protein [Jatrophihabitans sp. YIM 134969]
MDLSSPIGLAALAVAVAIVLAVVLRRRPGRVDAGADPVDPSSDAVSLAFLAGGPSRAVTAALSQLRAGGFVDGNGHPTSGPVGGLDRFDAVVLGACARHRVPTVATLVRDPEVRAATAALSDDLERRGLIDTRAARWALRAPQLIVFVAVGGGLLATHASGGSFVDGGRVVPLVGLVAVAFLASALVRRVPIAATARARRVLARARTDHAHLDPRLAPSFRTYGPRAAGLAVAVFGAGSVLGADPSFAAACGVLARSSSGTSGSSSDGGSMSWLGGDSGCCGSGGGGGSCGSGGSDGGASCGSSCGGGGCGGGGGGG